MWKALLKKQLLETLAFFTIGKNGKRRSPLAILGVAVLMGYVAVVLVLGVYEMAKMLCAPLALSGLTWVYFTLFSLMAWGLSCVLTIFTAKAKLYEAKDNRLLLSMPIPPWSILLSRMISLYLTALGLVALVFLPAVVCYWIYAEFTVLSLLFAVLAVAILPLGTLVISCLLGWLIAFVTARIRAKNLITTIFCVLFLTAYFIVYGKMNDYLTYILASGGIVGEKLGVVFPLRWLGLALSGEALPFLYFALVFIGVFALAYALLSATFLGVVTRETGVAKRAYKAKSRESKPVISALACFCI